MGFNTYSDFQNQAASEKEGLVILEAAKRLRGWVLDSGSVYRLDDFEYSVISALEDSGVPLSAAANRASIVAGTYYLDRKAQILYLQTADSANPNGNFIGLTFKSFYSRFGAALPHDLANGFEVYWLPLVMDTTEFGVELDNQNQLGVAIEGEGSVDFINDQAYWAPRYDKLYYENQRVWIYSWNRNLPVTEAKIVYRGRVTGKSWDFQTISFDLKDIFNELRANVAVPLLSDLSSKRIPDSLLSAYQRRLYGYVYGHRPTNIDQVLDGYPLTGTVSIDVGETTLVGSGTEFLTELNPDDVVILGADGTQYTVQSVTDDTHLELTEEFSDLAQVDVEFVVQPSGDKRYANRKFLIAGHALTEPVTTIVSAPYPNLFEVTSIDGFKPGDPLLINGESTSVLRISGSFIQSTTNLVSNPNPGDQIKRKAVDNVYLGTKKLILDRDYTYDASAGTLILDPLAEFHVANVRKGSGIAAFTSGSNIVTGSGTNFTSLFSPGDWIASVGRADFFEILSVDADDSITLRVPSTYTNSVGFRYKIPEIYAEGSSVLSCDVLGISEDGTTSGRLIRTGAQIVLDLLKLAGADSDVDLASFQAAEELATQRLGIAIPTAYSDTEVPVYRDVINEINQSIFGSMIQNRDFQIQYSILSPQRAPDLIEFVEHDVLGLKITNDSNRIVKTTKINYLQKEYDPISGAPISSTATRVSDITSFLAKTENEFDLDTWLVDPDDAQIYANRWGFIFEVCSGTMEITTKLQGARVQVNDQISLSHEKLYQRMGSSSPRKIGGVQQATKSVDSSTIVIEDLAGAFSRCGTITEDDAKSYSSASDKERSAHGYITDDYGMISNDADTDGVHLIW